MPRATKRATSRKSAAVSVRVVRTAERRRARPVSPSSPPAPQANDRDNTPSPGSPVSATHTRAHTETLPETLLPTPNARQRALVWGVGTSFFVIVLIWIAFLRFEAPLRLRNPADQALSNIGQVLSQIPSLANDSPAPANDLDSQDPQLQELREQVFPEFIDSAN